MLKNYNIGMAYYEKADWDGAIDAFLQSIYFARNNYAPKSYYWLALAYEAKHQDTKAIEACKKYIEQDTGNVAQGHMLLSELYMRNNRLDEAEEEAKEALNTTNDRTPDGRRARYMYGKLCEKKGDNPNAAMQYEFALGDQPWFYTEAWMAYSELQMKNGNWVGALEQFKAMLNSDKPLKHLDKTTVYRDMGQCLLAKGDHQGALINWHAALGLNPGDADTHLYLAMMLDAETHISSAIKEYKEFIRFSQDPRKVGKAKQRVEMLEQKIAPVEAPYQVKPSPYLRKQMEQQNGGQPVQQETASPNPKDSGF